MADPCGQDENFLFLIFSFFSAAPVGPPPVSMGVHLLFEQRRPALVAEILVNCQSLSQFSTGARDGSSLASSTKAIPPLCSKACYAITRLYIPEADRQQLRRWQGIHGILVA